MLEHEYALLGGINRASIGRWISIISAALSGTLVFLLLSAVDLAKAFGLNVNLPPTFLSLVGAGAVYGILFWLFDRYLWRLGPVAKLLKVPDLSGKWDCEGVPLDNGKAVPWQGEIRIVQSWDRIRVHLKTENSKSDSLAAALQYDAAEGYRLFYHYRNQPRVGSPKMAPHHGFTELVFAEDEQSAMGDYFNGRGRNTFGTLKISRAIS
ncbi:Cap15 family CBASS effector [Sphingomonas sp. RB1R13]|uniref:Cap15 family cyclic dinucleotide receptor domain-containing protein n=1 Tax=Sphingomonas sp. RB1R13 TaxID=3096159 RepID=UPI002FCB35F0